MSEVQEGATAPVADTKAVAPDPSSLSTEELGKLINSDPEQTRLGVIEDTASATPEVVEGSADEPEEQAVDDTEVSVAPEEDAPEPDGGEEPEPVAAETDPEIELLQLQLSKLERTLSSREGKYGNQQQMIDRLNQENARLLSRLDNGDLGGETTDFDVNPTTQPQAQPASATGEYVREMAMRNAMVSFSESNKGIMGEDGALDADYATHVKNASAGVNFSDDPRLVQQEVRDVLSNAYDDFKIAKLKERRESKRADQAANLKKNKRTAALSTSSTRSAPTKTKTPDPRKMSMDKLKDAIEQGIAG